MKLFLYISLLLLCLSAYSQENNHITHEGIRYAIYTANEKLPLPKIGDYIRMRLVKYDPNGKEVFNTDYFGDPYGVEVELTPPKYVGDVMEIFALMRNGDSAYVHIPTHLVDASDARHDSSQYFYKLYLNIIFPRNIYYAMKEEMKAVRLQQDSIAIAEYLHEHKIRRYYRDSTGVVIIKCKKIKPDNYTYTSKDLCVHYKGAILSGNTFDNSYNRGTPICFTTLTNSVIEGWDIGLRYFHKGEKGILLIPSYYGYGEKGNGNDIPPNAILYFELDVLK